MTTFPRAIVFLAAVFSLCVSGAAQAKTHLRRDEIKILSSSSVQVIFVGTDVPLGTYLDANHHAISLGGAEGGLADALNQHRLDVFTSRLLPYQPMLDKLALPAMDRKLTQDSLSSVPWLNELPWLEAKREPLQDFFVRDNVKQSQAQVVVFIEPQMLMAVTTGQLLMTCIIDVEVVNQPGHITHYDQSEFTAELDIEPDDLPPRTSTPKDDEDDEDVNLERMFTNDAAGFRQLLGKLTPQFQQKLYYFFTGQDTLPPPPAATAAAAK
ncbi:MAG TPA: hypothetical protein VF651_00810 [Gammaproteobacteria bacterium]